MSQENVKRLRRGFEHFMATGEFLAENVHADFVWDMSTFRGWPDRQTYQGIEGAMEFLAEWAEAWDDWEVEVEDYVDAGERVVVLLRQRGRSKATGVPVEMHFGQVWTMQDGQGVRMHMYASPEEALEAAGLRE
jgi:ketosteroid isomerase-like protein